MASRQQPRAARADAGGAFERFDHLRSGRKPEVVVGREVDDSGELSFGQFAIAMLGSNSIEHRLDAIEIRHAGISRVAPSASKNESISQSVEQSGGTSWSTSP